MSTIRAASDRLADSAVWCDVESGGYAGDLSLWEELAAASPGPVLELGCGTGRVALHLARRGHSVVGIDLDPMLVAAILERAKSEHLPLDAFVGDARTLRIGQGFGFVLAPMQVTHLLPQVHDRVSMLGCVQRHLAPGGLAAFALLDSEAAGRTAYDAEPDELVPDVRELSGWVYSSQPVAVRGGTDGLEIHRRRRVVSPDGELSEEMDLTLLAPVDLEEFEAQGREVGLRVERRRSIAPTDDHVGSVVVVLRAAQAG